MDKFIVSLECRVIFDVRGKTIPIYHVLHNPVYGGPNENAYTGSSSTLEIPVVPTEISSQDPIYFSQKDSVKKLVFSGSLPPIFVGDRIRAYIIAADRKVVHDEPKNAYDSGLRYVWNQRALKKIENPFKIEKLDANGNLLATYENPME